MYVSPKLALIITALGGAGIILGLFYGVVYLFWRELLLLATILVSCTIVW
jgi:hypothetical protein